jgi:uncharacterized protein YbjQ (UPF0145 family)
MIIVNTRKIEGREIDISLGLVRGSTTRARFAVMDFFAGIKSIIGGEVSEYTQLLADSREQAIERMVADANKLDADAIVEVRFTSSTIKQGIAEILAYGTAVKLK